MSNVDEKLNPSERTAPYDARSVANLVIDRAADQGNLLTQLQLYKIVYFAHGWYLAKFGSPLVTQAFEAWKYGPVVKVLHEAFRECISGPITKKAEKLDIFSGEMTAPDPITNQIDREFIFQIVDMYNAYDGWELSDLTHEQGTPWDQVWNSKIPVGNLGLRIDDESIRSYFVQLGGLRSQMH
jgi:uncharacterized phage-associated protein